MCGLSFRDRYQNASNAIQKAYHGIKAYEFEFVCMNLFIEFWSELPSSQTHEFEDIEAREEPSLVTLTLEYLRKRTWVNQNLRQRWLKL